MSQGEGGRPQTLPFMGAAVIAFIVVSIWNMLLTTESLSLLCKRDFLVLERSSFPSLELYFLLLTDK